jgi:hypothetical protein
MQCRAIAFDGPHLVVDQMVELHDPRDPVTVRRVRESVLEQAYATAPGRAHFRDLRITIEVVEPASFR